MPASRKLLCVLLFGLTSVRATATELPRHCQELALGTDASIAQAQTMSERWLAVRGKEIEETLTNPWSNPGLERNHPEFWIVRGIPAHTHRVETNGRIFRHYAPLEALEAIKVSQTLKSGFMPYVDLAPGLSKRSWVDVTGAFLTTPQTPRQRIGVAAHGVKYGYLDVVLPAGIPLIALEKDLIFVIPLRRRVFPWVAEAYRKYKNGELPTSSYTLDLCHELDREGGMPAFEANIPIQIVGEGLAP